MNNKFILSALVLLGIAVFFWMCKSTLEGFQGMRPWFGYEPGRYGPGWGRKGCDTVPSDCVFV